MSEPRSELEDTVMNTDKGSEEISLADNTHVTRNSSDNTKKTSHNSFEDAQPESLKISQSGANDTEVALSTVTGANIDTEWVLLDDGEKDSMAENVESVQMLEEQTRCHLPESEELSGVDSRMPEKILDVERWNNCKDSKTSKVKAMDNEGDNNVNTEEKVDLNDDDKGEKGQCSERIGKDSDFLVEKKDDENKQKTNDIPVDKETISKPEASDVPIDKDSISETETTDVLIDKEPISEPESSDVPIDTEPVSKSETMDLSQVEESSSKLDTIGDTSDKELIGKLNIKDQPIGLDHVNALETTDVPIDKKADSESENEETSETFNLKHDNLVKLHPETYKDVSKNDFHLGVTISGETKTDEPLAMCVCDDQSLGEEAATPTPQEDTTETSFDLPEFLTSSLTLLKQSENGAHGLVSSSIKPQVPGVISESLGEPKEDEVFVVLPKMTTTGNAGLSPLRESLESFESNTNKEDTFEKLKDVTYEVKDVAFKRNVQNIGVDLDNLKNEGKSNEAGNGPRDIAPSITEPNEEVSKDSTKDESSSNSNTDFSTSSQCHAEDLAQEKVQTPSLNMSRLILLISLVIVNGVAAAVAVPFAFMALGFEEGGIVSGSSAESLMEFSSSIDFGMFIIEMLTEVGSFNVAFLIFIGLVSGGITGGVLLASGLFRHEDTTKEKLGGGTIHIDDITERKEDLTTKDHGKTEKDIVQE